MRFSVIPRIQFCPCCPQALIPEEAVYWSKLSSWFNLAVRRLIDDQCWVHLKVISLSSLQNDWGQSDRDYTRMTLKRQGLYPTPCNDYPPTLLLETHPDIRPPRGNSKIVWQARRNLNYLVLQMSTTALLTLMLRLSSPRRNHFWKKQTTKNAKKIHASHLDHRHRHPIPRVGLGGCELVTVNLITNGAFTTDPRHPTLLEDLTKMRRRIPTHRTSTPKLHLSQQLRLHSPPKDPANWTVVQNQRLLREEGTVTVSEVLGSGDHLLKLKR